MKKSELIKLLTDIPGDPEVCILNWKRNLNTDTGEGSSVGIYPAFEVAMVNDDAPEEGDEPDEDFKPFLALSFDDEDETIES